MSATDTKEDEVARLRDENFTLRRAVEKWYDKNRGLEEALRKLREMSGPARDAELQRVIHSLLPRSTRPSWLQLKAKGKQP